VSLSVRLSNTSAHGLAHGCNSAVDPGIQLGIHVVWETEQSFALKSLAAVDTLSACTAAAWSLIELSLKDRKLH